MEYLSDIITDGAIASTAQGYLMGAASEMPAANADRAGLVVMYTGATTEYYTANTLYKCVESSTPGTYMWTALQLPVVLTMDSTPTDGSTNPVTSDGIYDALAGKEDALTFDSAPTENSDNPVTSGGVYTALANKQATLTFDSAPTENSANPVTSDGIYDALAQKQDNLTIDSVPTASSTNPVQSGGVFSALGDKQDTLVGSGTGQNIKTINNTSIVGTGNISVQPTLTFDSEPTNNSTNPVTSGGVYSALSGKQNTLTFDDSPTSGSNNPVKSGGVYTALGDKFDIASMITTTGSGASAGITAQDPIAMKGWVNSSISTNTATFRGTYNVEGNGTYDLGLTITYDSGTGAVTGPSNSDIATALASKMTALSITPTNNDYVFVSWDYASDTGNIDKYDRFKYTDGTPGAWSYEFTLNNSSFTADQWAAINSGINTTKVGLYDGYASTIAGKQDALTSTTVTLASTDWVSSAQTVNVSNMTTTATVWVSPAPASLSAYGEAGVYCSAQAAGTLTFTCSTTPSANLTVNVVWCD